jgi:hypothetical protein
MKSKLGVEKRLYREQIIGLLREAEVGVTEKELWRLHKSSKVSTIQ